MKKLSINLRKPRGYVIVILMSLFVATLFWLSESLIHTYVFHSGSLSSQLLTWDFNELWMRFCLIVLIVFLGILLQYTFKERLILSVTSELTYQILSSIGNAALITNDKNEIIYINANYTKLTGYTLDEVMGKNPRVLSSGRQDKLFYKQLWATLLANGYWEGELWNRKKSGELFAEWIHISVIKDKEGRFLYYLALFSDISLRKNGEEKLTHYAYYDPLTDLPNRRHFEEQLQHAIEFSKRNHQQIAILFMDVNGFKKINDQYGHEAGDIYLCHVAKVIKSQLRQSDIVSRFGGDEFVLALLNIHSDEAVRKLCEKLKLVFDAASLQIDNTSLPVKVSIGFAIYPDHGSEAKSLIRYADERMYEIKLLNKNIGGAACN